MAGTYRPVPYLRTIKNCNARNLIQKWGILRLRLVSFCFSGGQRPLLSYLKSHYWVPRSYYNFNYNWAISIHLMRLPEMCFLQNLTTKIRTAPYPVAIDDILLDPHTYPPDTSSYPRILSAAAIPCPCQTPNASAWYNADLTTWTL